MAPLEGLRAGPLDGPCAAPLEGPHAAFMQSFVRGAHAEPLERLQAAPAVHIEVLHEAPLEEM